MQQTKPATALIQTAVKRPDWITRLSKQNVIELRDDSPSMEIDNKARDASAASIDLTDELAQPANKDGFRVSVIDFAGHARTTVNLTAATALAGRVPPLSGSCGGSTNLHDPLAEALRIVDQKLPGDDDSVVFLRPVVILFTDGCHNEGTHPMDIANRLKARADLVCVAFGTDADETLLKQLATSPQHFYRCRDGRELRNFMAAVGATMTGTMSRGTNATQALTAVTQ
jgi:uncharacterized protein YegL